MMNIVTTHNSRIISHSEMSGINSTCMEMMTEDMSEPSSPESAFDESDLLGHAVNDDVTAQLAAAGPIGVAAAAAIATGKKRKRPFSFETNPSIRKRQQTRLLRKLKQTIDEYTTRVGQQAIVLGVTPGKSNHGLSYKVFGSQPLENVIRNCKGVIMQDLESALAQQAPPPSADTSSLHELPPLNVDGIPTPIDKMTQAQLRAFIPEMLKYSTGRSKPGWGKPEYRPVWWPIDLPWANVRSDVRSDDQKKKVSWTHALRQIVKNCYKHHGREDLLPAFDENISSNSVATFAQPTMVQTINNPDGTVSIIQIDTSSNGNAVVTLGDGTQATVVQAVQADHMFGNSHGLQLVQLKTDQVGDIYQNGAHEANQAVQTLAEVASSQSETGTTVATLTEATLNQETGQIILTGDGSGLGMVTLPVSMYSTVVTNISQLQDQQQQHHHHHQQEHQNVHIALAPQNSEHNQSADVPDATNAVEIMTIEQGPSTST
ncbi:DNA-binding protein P3A2-like isoform X2 [Tubulanus polymorphus]|uniref:DNA-binding protein P3A2-like isoform X2 n=1 Tax=Tubulanus polymorphus TaxID=672921 RepID=UPI003DA2D2B5